MIVFTTSRTRNNDTNMYIYYLTRECGFLLFVTQTKDHEAKRMHSRKREGKEKNKHKHTFTNPRGRVKIMLVS
jgi:hypothetical protein